MTKIKLTFWNVPELDTRTTNDVEGMIYLFLLLCYCLLFYIFIRMEQLIQRKSLKILSKLLKFRGNS